ncbi:MAG: thioredoxin-disulfide reductase [Desulfovibrionaceae bacterium]|jgi:thioredoxin reductase (NADPH)|nr:thioredoxin-disulfide reductase [Desulfovibrionaceae bacterium]
MKKYDCLVIGGGPAGMTAALYLLRSGVKTAMVEKLSPGGQVLLTETIDNYPGFPKGIKGYEMADVFAEHLTAYEELDRFNDEVRALEHDGPGLNRVRIGDEWVEAASVILATGAVFRKLGLPREKELTGRGVSYCALCDGNFFRNQIVAVVGGGNSALEESLYLAKLVDKLYLIHRRDEFRGNKCYQDKVLNHPRIEPVLNTVVEDIVGENAVEGLRVCDVKTGEKRTIEVAGVFIFIGYTPPSAFLPKALESDGQGFVITDQEMRTNLPGIFAAGDIRAKLCRQVATAVGDGATAANAAFLFLEEHGFSSCAI